MILNIEVMDEVDLSQRANNINNIQPTHLVEISQLFDEFHVRMIEGEPVAADIVSIIGSCGFRIGNGVKVAGLLIGLKVNSLAAFRECC